MEKNLKDLYFVSVYYSFDCDSPLYVFSTEKEAVAFIRKQYQDELNIECRELEIDMSVSEKDYSDYGLFVNISDDGNFARIEQVNDDPSFIEWNLTTLRNDL